MIGHFRRCEVLCAQLSDLCSLSYKSLGWWRASALKAEEEPGPVDTRNGRESPRCSRLLPPSLTDHGSPGASTTNATNTSTQRRVCCRSPLDVAWNSLPSFTPSRREPECLSAIRLHREVGVTPSGHFPFSKTPSKGWVDFAAFLPQVDIYIPIRNIGHQAWLAWLTWLECHLVDQRVTGSIPGQGTCLGCGLGPRLGVGGHA